MTMQSTVFESRLKRIDRKHRKMAGGIRTVIDQNGLVTEQPARNYRLPLRGMVMVLLGLFVFKAFLMQQLGGAEYAARLAKLEQGTVVEQLGAVVLRPDPFAIRIAQGLDRLL